MASSTPTVLVAAAPTLYRQGLVATLLKQWPQLRLALTADATQVADLIGSRLFGLLVLDARLLGTRLPTLLDQLQRQYPAQRLVLLTTSQRPGAPIGFPEWPAAWLLVSRQARPDVLAAGLRLWLDAPDNATRPARTNRPHLDRADDQFSARELEVLRLVVNDHCNQEIAHHLAMSVRTVESHRRSLLQKAGTRTLGGLAARAVREGWVA